MLFQRRAFAGGSFYHSADVLVVSFQPTARCHFCGGTYYLDKLAVHEAICSLRPKRLTVMGAIRLAIRSHPEASSNSALLVRLVWEIRDGYRTEPPRGKLTDPISIARTVLLNKKLLASGA